MQSDRVQKTYADVEGDLCLGMLTAGVSDVQLVIFAASLREVAPLADIVLFVDDARPDEANRRDEIVERCARKTKKNVFFWLNECVEVPRSRRLPGCVCMCCLTVALS